MWILVACLSLVANDGSSTVVSSERRTASGSAGALNGRQRCGDVDLRTLENEMTQDRYSGAFLRVGIFRASQCHRADHGSKYAEWCDKNLISSPSTSKLNSARLDSKPKPRDYTFKEWMLIKVGHTNVNESVKRTLLNSWVIDHFEAELGPTKDPRSRSFDDYKWVFDLEIDQLADEYELGIGKKGLILEEI
ncbi:hypothetical protein Tco_0937500 [Tanacetum coccineum]|uniref:Uncharacterized protein n=1 Tax=Tanacetum coccineum TaxID=301880 RepID=A0ABQ5DEG0_9ASTR